MTDEEKRAIAAAYTVVFQFLRQGGRIDGSSDIQAAIFNERLERFVNMVMPGEPLDISLLDKED